MLLLHSLPFPCLPLSTRSWCLNTKKESICVSQAVRTSSEGDQRNTVVLKDLSPAAPDNLHAGAQGTATGRREGKGKGRRGKGKEGEGKGERTMAGKGDKGKRVCKRNARNGAGGKMGGGVEEEGR